MNVRMWERGNVRTEGYNRPLSVPTFPRSHRPTARAFTLLELLVVVVLLSLAATTVALRLHGATDAARLRGATVRIEQLLRLARQQATTRHEPVWVQFDPPNQRGRLLALHRADHEHRSSWRSFDSVRLGRLYSGARIVTPDHEGLLALRLTPRGASLPWALELQAAQRRRIVWTDGVTGRLQAQDDLTLEQWVQLQCSGETQP